MKVASKGLMVATVFTATLLFMLLSGSLAYAKESVLIDDDAHSLSEAGWVRQNAPRAGTYITDSPNSLGNPSQIPMKQVMRGQYLFYSSENLASDTITKEIPIGAGSWTIEFEARIADLITPSENPAWNGFAIDTIANHKRYRVTFNSKTGEIDSTFKVLIMKNSFSAYDETEIKLGDFADIHKWGISYDGGTTLTVSLDGKVVARSSSVNVTSGFDDKVMLYNSTTGIQSGTNEVYLYNYKFVKGGNLHSSEEVVHDNAASFTSAGWTASVPLQGQYIIDNAHSQGNPNAVALKSVSKGQYLFYSDQTAASSTPVSMSLNSAIGSGSWTLQLRARIADLMQATTNGADTGLLVEVVANQKLYKLIFNNRDIITAIKDSSSGSYSQARVDMPTDDQFHSWSISYDGGENIYVDLDGVKVAEFGGMGISTTQSDGITLTNAAQNRLSGTTEVYMDSIMLTINSIPEWVKVKSDAYLAENSENVLTDFTERLLDNGWVRSADPVDGNYISDFSNSLGNPNQASLLAVPQSQYLFYASSTGTASSLTKSPLTIGTGPWFLELDANIVDLITPSADSISNGISVDVIANMKKYKVTFNSMDANGDLKIVVLKDNSGTVEEKQLTLPPDGKVHKWGIGYDGGTTLTVNLDGTVVMRVSGVHVPDSVTDRIVLHNNAGNLQSGTNKVYLDLVKLDITNVPDWVYAAIDDDGDNLSQSSWTRPIDPVNDSYITDHPNSLGNPNQVQMLPVSSGKYLFYSAQDSQYSAINNNIHIGSGAWYAQLEARFADLPTPSAYQAWRGFSVDIAANSKRYRLSFNSIDSNGNMNIYLLKPGNTYEMKQVALPSSGGFHQWGIAFDGTNAITVDLDGTVVARFTYTELTVAGADSMKLFADTNNLLSGTTEVYVDRIRLLRNFKPKLHDSSPTLNTLLDDNASSLSAAGWVSNTSPRTGVYMIDDDPNSLGNPNGVSLKPVPAGQYLAYADGTSTSGYYSSMKRNLSIGPGAWTLQFDARIIDLAKATNYYLWKGLSFNIYANNKRYIVSMNNYDPVKGTIRVFLITNGSNAFQEREVYIPTDNAFHKWEIVYDGDGGLYLGLDDNLLAQSNNAGIAATTGDNISIINLANDIYTTGTNEVYFDQIKFTKNKVPEWINYYPNLSGVTVKPEASSSSVPILVNISGADPTWFTNPDIQVKASIYSGTQLLSSSTHALDAATVSLDVNGGGGTGVRQLVVELSNNNISVDKVIKEIQLFPAVTAVNPNDSVTSSPGAVALYTEVDQMINGGNQIATAAGWQAADYKYKGADESVAGNVYSLIESTASAQALRLPVDLYGWFGVYIGYVAGTEQFDVTDGNITHTIELSPGGAAPLYSEQTIREEFVTAANFNGRTFSIIPSASKKARIAYVKLRGLTTADIAEYTMADEGSLGKRAIYNNDGYTHFTSLKYHNVESIENMAINIFDGQDAGGVDWALGTTMQLNYDSQYAGAPFDSFTEDDPTLREIDLYGKANILNIYDESGKWAPEVLAERANDIGIDFSVSLRMNAFYTLTSFPALNGQLYNDYIGTPYDARQLDANGNPTFRLSYNNADFRSYIKNILMEAAAFPHVDGVNLDFGRYPYLFAYELTDVASRKAIITQMLSEIRTALPGKTISVRIPYWNYEGYGLDPQAWIDQDLIDTLIPTNLSYEDFFDISPFVSMAAGSNVKIYAGIVSDLSGTDLTKEQEAMIRNGGTHVNTKRTLSQTQYQKRTYEVYEAGADGVYIFNDWWNGKGIFGLLGDKVKVRKWHYFDYYSQLQENPIFIMQP
ncbi:hypothetical protein B1748_19420 [Paenibacillus sp. MY03]|uniref:hypothetical protein n=1 Tax=Paenibacillus sp. MY03 TaxID=302980 RepID=UPI000B3CC7FE|nr:hypothetical protein [Paenibacillus sp. MY03]OUS75072.1 hypothetical protein B1748_19420 [Paenibacillus sp. MY03]